MDLLRTIVAPATGEAPAPRHIVRTSGPDAVGLAEQLADQPLSIGAFKLEIPIGNWPVPATLLVFRSPRSSTGDDVVEYHLPGNPILTRRLVDQLIAGGAELAQPGEFTARAFFNGKLTLEAAEAVSLKIAATSDAQLDAAARIQNGQLGRRLADLVDQLATLLSRVELAIDFVEEDVDVLLPGEADRDIAALIQALTDPDRAGQLASTGLVKITLVGHANAGKSTLMNALLGERRVVTSDIAGTTRDVVTAELDLPAGRVRLVDVAGAIEAESNLDSLAESSMRQAIAESDFVVLCRDANDDRPPPSFPRVPDLVVRTKVDLYPGAAGLSAITGVGLPELRQQLNSLAFAKESDAELLLTSRHRDAIRAAIGCLRDARESLESGDELAAAALREALDELGSVVGLVSPDDILGRVFSSFCIGK